LLQTRYIKNHLPPGLRLSANFVAYAREVRLAERETPEIVLY
jgi:hypothetical protein